MLEVVVVHMTHNVNTDQTATRIAIIPLFPSTLPDQSELLEPTRAPYHRMDEVRTENTFSLYCSPTIRVTFITYLLMTLTHLHR